MCGYMWNIKLSRTELLIFRFISSGNYGLGSISKAAGMSVNRVSEVLRKLEEKGFILEMNRRPKRVGFNNLEHSMALHTLFLEMSHIDWSKYLDNSSIPVLISIVDEFLKPDRMTYGTSLKTVYNVLKKFRSIGAVQKKGKAYGISSRFHLLKFFLVSYSKYYYRQLIPKIDPEAWIIWNGGNRVLFGSRSSIEDDRVVITGIQAVPEFFPDLVCDHYLYVVPKREKLPAEEHLAYTLRGLSNEGRVRRAIKELIRNKMMDLNVSHLHGLAERMGVGHLLENRGMSSE